MFAILMLALAPGGDEPSIDQLREDIQRVDGAIRLLRTLDELKLTAEQSKALVDVVTEAAELTAAYAARVERILAEQVGAFAAFREEDRRNAGFSPEVEARTHRSNEKGKNERKRFFERINALEARVEAILTGEQRGWLDREPRRDELRQIDREHYGAIGPIGRALIHPDAGRLLALRAGLPAPPIETVSIPDCAGEVRTLRDDINLLNLVNGLNLSVEQMEAILAAARTAAPSIDDLQARLDALSTALARMEEGAPFRKVPAGRPKPIAGARQIEAVRDALSEAQRQVLLDYNPCLVPPKDLKDPVRVGQANDRSGAVRLMERLRDIPEKKFHAGKDRIVDEAILRAEKRHGAFPADERDAVSSRLAELVDRIRAMGDDEFALSKNDLAAESDFLNRKKTIEDEMTRLSGATPESVVARKIRQHLLHPRIVPVLEERLADLRSAGEPRQVDLNTVPAAPSCGRCAGGD